MNKILRLHNGYYVVRMNDNKERQLQDLIMESRIGRPLSPDEIVHHNNEIRTDNSYSNLTLMTRAEHSRLHSLQRIKAGRNYDISKECKKGEYHLNAKLKESDVINIFNNPNTYSKIAIEYNVTKSCIKHIKRGRSWKHLNLYKS